MRYATLLLPFALWGCDTLECGEGTHREGDVCVANVLVRCAEGTALLDGRCVADLPDAGPTPDGGGALRCGAGTHEEGGVCVPDDPAGDRDMAVAPPDPDDGVEPDGPLPDPDDGVEPDMAAEDPDMGAAPTCPEALTLGQPEPCPAVAGTYCVYGTAQDFLTGCALPADADLQLAVIDPIAAAAGASPQEYVRGLGVVGANGTFAINCAGEANQLALVIDEDPMAGADDVWTRSVSGVSPAAPTPGDELRVTAFASDQATQARWNAALGLGDKGLEQTGFLVGRVLTITEAGIRPVAGAEVRGRQNPNLARCDDGASCLRYFDDDPRLVGFQDVGAGATGASGAFLVIRGGGGALIDAFHVANMAGTYADIPAGANPGSGFHTAFVPQR